MGLPTNSIVPTEAFDFFSRLTSELPKDQQPILEYLTKMISTEVCPPGYNDDFSGTMNMIKRIFIKETAGLTTAGRRTMRRALVAKLALALPSVVDDLDLPGSIQGQYPGAVDRLASYLAENRDDGYGFADDIFVKDICLTLGRSIPCGALILELGSAVRLRSIVRDMLVSRNPGMALRFFQANGKGEWFRIHTAARNLAEFNESGWEACYLRIADLLERRTNIRGMVGTSWFYDPQLVDISPRLAYLQQRLLERGAFRIGHRGLPIDIKRAIMTSKTRRKMYEEGKYIPGCYSFVWPRKQLLDWAHGQKKDGNF